MSDLLGALESVDAMEGVEPQEVNLESALFELMEAEHDILDAQAEMDDATDIVAQLDASIEDLTAIAASIEEFGISAPVMKMADAKAELSAAGIVCDYSDLEVTPTKDTHATAAMEGIVDTVKKMWEKLIKFFASVGRKIAQFFAKMMNGFKSYQKVILGLRKKLKDVTVDESKLKDAKVKAFKKGDAAKISAATGSAIEVVLKGAIRSSLGNITGNLNKDIKPGDISKELKDITASLSSIKGDNAKMLGLEIKEKDGEITAVNRIAPSVKRKKDTVGTLGYAAADIDKILASAYDDLNAAEKMDKELKHISSSYDTASKAMKGAMSSLGDKDAKAKNKAASTVKELLAWAKTVASVALSMCQQEAAAAIALGKAAISNKKK